jgi:predicted dinucleotide-utilizing enzyme
MDILQNLNDKIETDPADLEPLFVAVMTSNLAKQLAAQYKKPWTLQLETELQERISALVAAARAKGIRSFGVIVTRPNGDRVVVPMDVAKIAKTRSLQ